MNISKHDFETIAQFPLFEGLNVEALRTLLDGSRIQCHNHRGTLFEFGDPATSFAIVVEGSYKLLKPTIKGDDFIMYFATPGDGIGALLMGQGRASTYPITVKAIGYSRACIVPKSTFQNSWKSHAPILLKLNALVFSRMGIMQDEKALSRAPLVQRVAWFLMKMLERRNEEITEHVIPLPLTRQEIADHLGVTVESVIRIMSQWSQLGIVKTTDRLLEIVRVDQLINILKEVE